MTEASREALGEVNNLLADNPGLVFERYYPVGDHMTEKHPARRAMFRRLKSAATPTEPYREAYGEWRQTLTDAGAALFEVESLARVVVGLGAPSPYENGMLLNRTYGTPLLPGSTLKGAMRDAAAELLGLDRTKDLDPSQSPEAILAAHPNAGPLLATFGSVEAMAAVTVLDAWWNPADGKSPFVPDTITNHHPTYYTGNAPLALETENPNPVSYLALRKGVRFTIALLLPNEAWREAVEPVLDRALKNGIGAKVGQGYGRFRREGALVAPAAPALITPDGGSNSGGARSRVPEPTEPAPNLVPPPLPDPLPHDRGNIALDGVVARIEGRTVTVLFANGQTVTLNLRQPPREDRLKVGDEVRLDAQIQGGNIRRKRDELFKGETKIY